MKNGLQFNEIDEFWIKTHAHTRAHTAAWALTPAAPAWPLHLQLNVLWRRSVETHPDSWCVGEKIDTAALCKRCLSTMPAVLTHSRGEHVWFGMFIRTITFMLLQRACSWKHECWWKDLKNWNTLVMISCSKTNTSSPFVCHVTEYIKAVMLALCSYAGQFIWHWRRHRWKKQSGVEVSDEFQQWATSASVCVFIKSKSGCSCGWISGLTGWNWFFTGWIDRFLTMVAGPQHRFPHQFSH